MKMRVAVLAALSAAVPSFAQATVVTGEVTGGTALDAGGTFVKLTVPFDTPEGAPNTVGEDTFQSPNLYVFDEDQNILISEEVEVDIGSNAEAGDIVASHYVFFDPDGLETMTATVTFDADIFGVMTSTALLGASDFLANTGVTYLSPGMRGLESNDSVTIVDARTIFIDFTAATPGDYIRVLTMESPMANPVPLPAAAPLFAAGLAGLAGIARRKKAASAA